MITQSEGLWGFSLLFSGKTSKVFEKSHLTDEKTGFQGVDEAKRLKVVEELISIKLIAI